MTTNARIGSGTLVELSDGSSPLAWVTLGEVGDIDAASDTVDQVDATHMQSGRREELIPGLIRGSEGSIPMNYVPGSASDDLIQEFISAGEQRYIRFTYPNLVTEQYLCIPTSYTRRIPVGDKMTATFGFKKTGDTTWGVTS